MGFWLVRTLIWSVTTAFVVIATVAMTPRAHVVQVARWFMPGALGHEAGGAHAKHPAGNDSLLVGPDRKKGNAQRAFFTRAFSGLRSAEALEWGERNGLGGRLPFSHNLTQVFPPELYKTHPEFFPLEGGKRLEPPKGSYFWNPDIAREDAARHAAEAARRHFAAHPDAVSFALGVNDALIWGESPELLALATPTTWFRERPDYSNVVFTFMNRAAGELSRTHPDKYVGALAYYWCENVPDFPLHPQVIPFLTADRSQGYDASFWREEMELQAAWGQLAGRRTGEDGRRSGSNMLAPRHEPAATADRAPERRLGLYDYLYGGGFLIPRLHTKLLAEHLRHGRSAGFTDYYAEVNPNWGLDGITPWLTAQLLQNPDQSEIALLDEYYGRYFREAAQPMRRFHERCEEQWMRQPGPAYWLKHYRNESQAIIFPLDVCSELRSTLDEALEQARSARVRERVRLVSDAFGVTERFVAFKEARDRVLRLALRVGRVVPNPPLSHTELRRVKDDAPRDELSGALGEYLQARRDFIRYTYRLQKSKPLALHPFGWSDYLKNDPVPTALFALSAAHMDADGQRIDADTDALMGSVDRDPLVAPLWSTIRASVQRDTGMSSASVASGSGKELLHDAAMTGALLPGRTIAGLTYGVALPAGWQSKVEPAQFHRAELVESHGLRVLRVEGTKDTTVSQWTQRAEPGLHHGMVRVRGRVLPGTAVSLVFAWLDAQHRHVGFKSVRLPEGEWPEWVTLQQAGSPPGGAVWVGLGLRVQNQVEGDWIEAKGFSLREIPRL